jgi:hypothetical protein
VKCLYSETLEFKVEQPKVKPSITSDYGGHIPETLTGENLLK